MRISNWLMKPVNALYNWFALITNDVIYTSDLRLGGRLLIRNRGTLSLGKGVTITSSLSANPVGGQSRTVLYVSPGGQLKIEDHASLSNVTIFCQDAMDIGENVMLGGGVQIYDSNFHSTDYAKRISRPDPDIRTAPVVIKEGAFIGTCSLILKGVTIGRRSVIAAGSVVVTSVPDGEIWGGNPAKFIKRLED